VNKRNEVEKFKLTREQLAFQKTYKKIASIARMLQGEMQATAQKGASLGQMMQEVTGQMNQLLQAAPPRPLKELSGQLAEPIESQSGNAMF